MGFNPENFLPPNFLPENFLPEEAGNQAPVFDGPDIGSLFLIDDVTPVNNDYTSRFSDEGVLTYSLIGTLPAGLTFTDGVLSGTATETGTFSGLRVRATDEEALTVDSNEFTIVVAAAGSAGGTGRHDRRGIRCRR